MNDILDSKVSTGEEVAWQNSSRPNLHGLSSFFCSFSWVRAPPKENFFLLNLILNGLFFVYFNVSKSFDKPQRGEQSQNSKKEGNRDRDLFM